MRVCGCGVAVGEGEGPGWGNVAVGGRVAVHAGGWVGVADGVLPAAALQPATSTISSQSRYRRSVEQIE